MVIVMGMNENGSSFQLPQETSNPLHWRALETHTTEVLLATN